MPVRARALAAALAMSASFVIGVVPGVRPQPVAAAAPKVAILVGPTAITDSHYYRWAKELRATARAAGATVDLRYCATPKQAKAATNGADIIVYFGHGNGFPNPYSATESTDRVNGWGLRDPSKAWNGASCTDCSLATALCRMNSLASASGNVCTARASPAATWRASRSLFAGSLTHRADRVARCSEPSRATSTSLERK